MITDEKYLFKVSKHRIQISYQNYQGSNKNSKVLIFCVIFQHQKSAEFWFLNFWSEQSSATFIFLQVLKSIFWSVALRQTDWSKFSFVMNLHVHTQLKIEKDKNRSKNRQSLCSSLHKRANYRAAHLNIITHLNV